jgi:hypothetical protein
MARSTCSHISLIGTCWTGWIASAWVQKSEVRIGWVETLGACVWRALVASVFADIWGWNASGCWWSIRVFLGDSIRDGAREIGDVACAQVDS